MQVSKLSTCLGLSLLLAACSRADSELPDVGGFLDASVANKDAEIASGDAGSIECSLTIVREQAPVTELTARVGAYYKLSVQQVGVEDLQLQGGADFAAKLVADSLEIVAPYNTEAKAEVTLVGRCTTTQQPIQAGLKLSSQPVEFKEIKKWTPGQNGPIGREYTYMWIDTQNQDRLYLMGGFHYRPQQFTAGRDIWALDLNSETWSDLGQMPLEVMPGGAIAQGPGNELLTYAGLNVGQLSSGGQTPFYIHQVTTTSSGLAFEQLSVGRAPRSGDYQPAWFYHAGTQRYYTACGINSSDGVHCNLSSYDHLRMRWRTMTTQGEAPRGRVGHFWAYDAPQQKLYLFAGEGNPQTSGCDNCLHDTWSLDMSTTPPTWTKLTDETQMLGRRNGAYVLDSYNQRLLVFGGTSDGRSSKTGLWALQLTPGQESWIEVPFVGDIPARASGIATYDSKRKRVLVGFGNGDGGVEEDLWSLELN